MKFRNLIMLNRRKRVVVHVYYALAEFHNLLLRLADMCFVGTVFALGVLIMTFVLCVDSVSLFPS